MDGILKNGLSGFFDLLKPFLGMFGNHEGGPGLFERLASGFGDPAKVAMKARTEMGVKIGDLLASSDPEKHKYGEYVAKKMMEEHRSGHDQNTKYLLVGAGFNLKQIGEVDKAFKDGLSVDISHLKVVSDPKTGQKIIQDPVVYKEAPSVQASAIPPKSTDWDAERAARDARQKDPDGVQTFGIQPPTPPVVTNL